MKHLRRLFPFAFALSLVGCSSQTPVTPPTTNVVIEQPATADQCPRNDGSPCR